MVEIYGLFDPDTGDLRYVGKAKDSGNRFKRHIDERRLNRPVNLWVRSLVASGKVPVLKVLEVVEDDKWEEAERRLIAEHRKTAKLLNLADGGAMPSQTKKQRKKAARASNELQKAKPEAWKKFIRAKQELARLHARFAKDPRSYKHAAHLRFLMRIDAAKDPELYGSWANL